MQRQQQLIASTEDACGIERMTISSAVAYTVLQCLLSSVLNAHYKSYRIR